MKRWSWLDKSDWGDGPWMQEPDKVEWCAHGLVCLAVRHESLGHWCGYVGVPPGHPAYGKEGSLDVLVHGGLTYARPCDVRNKEHGVCHVARPGEPEPLFWLGFDCAHAGDLSPALAQRLRYLGLPSARGAYRTLPYVRGECALLAAQLAVMK